MERAGTERVEVTGMGKHGGWEQSQRHDQAQLDHTLKHDTVNL
jgi:hypothetical protein